MSMQRVVIEATFESVDRAAPAILAGDCNFRPDTTDRARLLGPLEAATPAYLDAWEIAHPGRPHEPPVGVHDKEQCPASHSPSTSCT